MTPRKQAPTKQKRRYRTKDHAASSLQYYSDRKKWSADKLVKKGRRLILTLLVVDSLIEERAKDRKSLLPQRTRGSLAQLIPSD